MKATSSTLLACLLVCAADCGARADESRPFSSISAVRELSLKDAGSAKQVRLRGTVTYIAPLGTVFFVQDDTGGICVSGQRDKQLRPELKLGAIVEVEGVTAAGRVTPHLTARRREPMKVSVVGESPLPEPKVATISQLNLPAFQEVRVELSGVVRSVRSEPLGNSLQENLLLTLADGHHRLTVAIPGWRAASGLPQHLVAAAVKVRGVYTTAPLDRQPISGNRLFLSSLKELQVEQAAPAPFAGATESVATARDFARDENENERLRIRGLVTVAVPGKGMFLEDLTGGIWVDAKPPPPVGQTVDAAGFPGLREGTTVIEDAVWRTGEKSLALNPPTVTSADALSGTMNGRLVHMEALLLAVSAAGEGPTLVLQSGERVFLARYGNSGMRLPSLGENSWLHVTGVCVNTPQTAAHEFAPARPASFHLLLAGPQSIEIARTPSWWTVQRVLAVLGIMAIVALASAIWATTLRRRVAVQTGQIREHLAREAVAEERLRIARELHDSVQQDLLGISMQLKATERLLDSDPDTARQALSIASAMARRSQAETHRAVWDLREADNENRDIVTALDDMVAGMNTGEGARVEFNYTGERRPLDQAVERNVIRIAQEAVTNAFKHGAATVVSVSLHFEPTRLVLLVRDDGKGFDTAQAPSASTGHFGLFGMRERAIKVQGELTVCSQPGQGTTVRLDLPVPAESGANETLQVASGMRLIPRTSSS